MVASEPEKRKGITLMDSRDVKTEIQELERLRSEMRVWRLSSLVILVILLAVCIGTLNRAVNGLTQDGPQRDQFVSALSGRLQDNAVPALETISVQALHSINFADEVKKLNGRTPELAAASMTQLQTLSHDLPERGREVLSSNFDSLLKSREAKIRAMYPSATEDQINTMMANLTEEANAQTGSVSDALFSPHLQAMNNIVTDLDTIRQTEPSSVGKTPTWDEAVELVSIADKDFQGIVPAGTAGQLTHAAGQFAGAASQLSNAAAPLADTVTQVTNTVSERRQPGRERIQPMTPEQPIGPDNAPEPLPPITPDTPTVAAGDLSAHHLTKELAQARISLQRTRIFTIVALLLIGGELTYITAKFSRSFQPQNAAEIADGMVMEQIEDHGDQLSQAIQQRIPQMIEQSPDYVLQQMPSYRQSIEDKVTDNLNDYFKTSSQTLGDNLDKFLDAHQDDVKQLLLNANDTDTIHKVGLDLKQQMLTAPDPAARRRVGRPAD